MQITPLSMTNQYRTNRSNLKKENISNVVLNNQPALNFKADKVLRNKFTKEVKAALRLAEEKGNTSLKSKIAGLLDGITTAKFSNTELMNRTVILGGFLKTLNDVSKIEYVESNKPETIEELNNKIKEEYISLGIIPGESVQETPQNKTQFEFNNLDSSNYFKKRDCIKLIEKRNSKLQSTYNSVTRQLLDLDIYNDLCINDFLRQAKNLLEEGANINAKYINGGTMVNYFIAYMTDKQRSISKELKEYFKYGLDPNAKIDIYTPRHHHYPEIRNQNYLHFLAYWKDDPDSVRVLAKHGVNINEKDACGDTPLDIAKERRHYQVSKVLRELGAIETNPIEPIKILNPDEEKVYEKILSLRNSTSPNSRVAEVLWYNGGRQRVQCAFNCLKIDPLSLDKEQINLLRELGYIE